MSGLAPASRQAFHELLDLLREIGEKHFTAERGIIEEVSAAEGYRFLLHLLAAGCEHHLEGDPERPMFTRTVSPQRKVLGDNPDSLYYWARIDGARSYRIRGFLDGAVYTSITVHGADPSGGIQERVIGAVSDRDLAIAPDGGYEIILSPQPPWSSAPPKTHENAAAAPKDPSVTLPAGEACPEPSRGSGGEGSEQFSAPRRGGNWLKLEPDATSVITRHYFERPISVASDPDASVRLRIDPLDDPGRPAPLSDAAVAARLRAVGEFLRGSTLGMPPPGQGPAYSFVSRVPNMLPRPASFGGSGVAAWGAVDIHYAMAPYLLQPDEALVMEGRLPACRFANVMLWNMHMQTLEYRFRRTSLNRAQMALGPGGSFRVVIAHRDPGVANWLDTEGHALGMIFWRIVLPESAPEDIRCSVRKVDEV